MRRDAAELRKALDQSQAQKKWHECGNVVKVGHTGVGNCMISWVKSVKLVEIVGDPGDVINFGMIRVLELE